MADEDFVEFAQAAAGRLRDAAFLMCRDWHLAQDLTQTTLAKVYANWRRVRRADEPHAYARKILLRCMIDQQRRRSSSELAMSAPPDRGEEHPAELRMTLLDAVATLPLRDRAIIVLRYWDDQARHDWLIAVLSDHHASREEGVRVVEKAATYVLKEMRAATAGDGPSQG
ncbi:RNA polymerase sigma factor (sigma-70 family) [Micromonospora sp. A202]|uniref:sigma factor n=1 Tax=Micromonospora sp. A202 TaxID=2572899 RepID=UPI001151832E|nr:sigma factor [Micromonospora sp. A202]TQJ23498.1 RNA polymerase sigma factor (sigma-70 family) [Micromonospora sp. A202]